MAGRELAEQEPLSKPTSTHSSRVFALSFCMDSTLTPLGGPAPASATHHQRVHSGQAPDVSLGGGIYLGSEPRLQPAQQAMEHGPCEGDILSHGQPHLCQMASQGKIRIVGFLAACFGGIAPLVTPPGDP